MNPEKMWDALYTAEMDLRYMINMNHARLSEEKPYSDTQIDTQREARNAARKAVEDHYKAVGAVGAYEDARELIPNQDAGSIDSAITFYRARIK